MKAKVEHRKAEEHKANNASSNASNSSSSNSDDSNNSKPATVINSAQDAENLVEHSMHLKPGTCTATPTDDGYAVSEAGNQMAIVHKDGSITWSSGDTQSYGDVSAPTSDN